MNADTTRSALFSDFVEPCPVCGVPCLGTYRFWCGREGLEVDQPRLDAALSSIVERCGEGYDLLPKFVREHHECRAGFETTAAVELDAVDFADTLALLELTPHASELAPSAYELVAQLRELLRLATSGVGPLMFLDN